MKLLLWGLSVWDCYYIGFRMLQSWSQTKAFNCCCDTNTLTRSGLLLRKLKLPFDWIPLCECPSLLERNTIYVPSLALHVSPGLQFYGLLPTPLSYLCYSFSLFLVPYVVQWSLQAREHGWDVGWFPHGLGDSWVLLWGPCPTYSTHLANLMEMSSTGTVMMMDGPYASNQG